jgi:ParB-like chromosome segregation protein Spo0J
MKITDIKPNPNNPRLIKDDKFKKLVKSIQDFPEMMAKRPIVCVTDVDGKIYPLGGNMRYKALKELNYKEIPKEWVQMADEWTEEQRREFVIKDNVGFGEWDWDQLANEWDVEELESWGLDVIDVKVTIDGEEQEIEEIFEPALELGIEKEYLMIVFENQEEHREAIEKLGLKKQREINNKKIELNNVGIQRVMKYENLRAIIE